MKHHKFVYIGESTPEINKNEHMNFMTNFQTAMLMSLVDRKLLTEDQAKLVLETLVSNPNQSEINEKRS